MYEPGKYSPFEIQSMKSHSNSSGITVLFSVTSITQVHAIHISYIAWKSTDLTLIHGSFTFEDKVSREISHIPFENIGRNFARIHGLTGFIINH